MTEPVNNMRDVLKKQLETCETLRKAALACGNNTQAQHYKCRIQELNETIKATQGEKN